MSERPLIPLMRAILWVGGFFVLVAGVQLWVFSGRTDDYFAWTIQSEMSAAFIGSFYWAASILALLSATQHTWARARLGVPGVLAFVWLTLIATLIHLDLFHLDDGPFTAKAAAWTWLVIYVVEPPVLLLAFVLQLRTPGGNPPASIACRTAIAPCSPRWAASSSPSGLRCSSCRSRWRITGHGRSPS